MSLVCTCPSSRPFSQTLIYAPTLLLICLFIYLFTYPPTYLTSHLPIIYPRVPHIPPSIYPTHPVIFPCMSSPISQLFICPPQPFIYSPNHPSILPSTDSSSYSSTLLMYPIIFHLPNPSISLVTTHPSVHPSVSHIYLSICLTTHLCTYVCLLIH